MTVTPSMIISRLPDYRDEWVLIAEKQYVPDIINEVSAAHNYFGGYYDMFSDLFYTESTRELADSLYTFCKRYIIYREEKENFQTTAAPHGLLLRGVGDCKHTASFIAGVISSLNRLYDCCLEANFLFVGYRKASEPYHVFVSLRDGDGGEIWIDPTPGSGGTPTLVIPKPV